MGQNDFYVGYFYDSNYLAHHGILGMHWGRRNGPPYPLDASDHSSSEKKAGWRKSLGGGRNESLYDRKINRLRRAAAASNRDADDLEKHGYREEAASVRAVAKKNLEKANKVQKLKEDNRGGLAPGQKKVLGVAGAAAGLSLARTAIAAVGYNAFVKELSDDVFRAPYGAIARGGLVRAGKVAAVAALATYGVMKLSSPERKVAKAQKKLDKAQKKLDKKNSKQHPLDKMYNKAIEKERKGGSSSAPKTLTAKPGVSKVTQRVIADYNSMSPEEFMKKYQVSKATYAKRVEKYGDPYMNSPLAKLGKKLQQTNQKRLDSAAKAAQKDADDLRKHGYADEAKAVQKVADKNKEKASKSAWNKSSTYSSDFLKYIKDDVVKPEMVDDRDLMGLLIMRYEEETGKKARR